MKRSTILIVISVLTAGLIALVNYVEGYFTSPPPYHIALMVGQIIGFNAIPCAIGAICFLFTRRAAVFFTCWLITFLVFGAGAVYQAHLESPAKASSLKQSDFSFSAPFAPWHVSFIGQPKVSHLHGIGGEPALQAEREYPNGSMCRAEIYRIPSDMPYNSTVAEGMLRRLAARDGLSDIALMTEITDFGPMHSMRGGKVLEGRNGVLAITYFTQVLFTDGSFIAMTVGAPASSYPTPEIMHFLNSVVK